MGLNLKKLAADLVAGPVGGLVEDLAAVADRFIQTPEEREQFRLERERLAAAAREAEAARLARAEELLAEAEQQWLADLADARQMNARLQEAASSSWMARNIAYLIDIFVTLIWGGLTLYIIGRIFNLVDGGQGSPDLTAIMGIYAGITASFTTVLSFHRGTSRGSEAKDMTIRNILNRPTP